LELVSNKGINLLVILVLRIRTLIIFQRGRESKSRALKKSFVCFKSSFRGNQEIFMRQPDEQTKSFGNKMPTGAGKSLCLFSARCKSKRNGYREFSTFDRLIKNQVDH